MRKTVVFDFDGVIHSYSSGWQGVTVIPDPPVEGIVDALKDIHDAGYEIVISSTRCNDLEGVDAIFKYLEKIDASEYVSRIESGKPPAICYIDDRSICFDGHPETLLSKIINFVPYNKKKSLKYEYEVVPVLLTNMLGNYYVCPNCGEFLIYAKDFKHDNYCKNCGKKLNWLEVEKK